MRDLTYAGFYGINEAMEVILREKTFRGRSRSG